MKQFLIGLLWALSGVVATLILMPAYTDYRAASETSEWLSILRTTTQDEIAAYVKQNKTIVGANKSIQLPQMKGVTLAEIRDDGSIFVKGGIEGQLIVLLPTIARDQVTWRCLGGSSKAIRRCK
jgi:hypothetical protein